MERPRVSAGGSVVQVWSRDCVHACMPPCDPGTPSVAPGLLLRLFCSGQALLPPVKSLGGTSVLQARACRLFAPHSAQKCLLVRWAGGRLRHNIQRTYEGLRKRCQAPFAYGLCSSKAILSHCWYAGTNRLPAELMQPACRARHPAWGIIGIIPSTRQRSTGHTLRAALTGGDGPVAGRGGCKRHGSAYVRRRLRR